MTLRVGMVGVGATRRPLALRLVGAGRGMGRLHAVAAKRAAQRLAIGSGIAV